MIREMRRSVFTYQLCVKCIARPVNVLKKQANQSSLVITRDRNSQKLQE
jgi:hypothetical protein